MSSIRFNFRYNQNKAFLLVVDTRSAFSRLPFQWNLGISTNLYICHYIKCGEINSFEGIVATDQGRSFIVVDCGMRIPSNRTSIIGGWIVSLLIPENGHYKQQSKDHWNLYTEWYRRMISYLFCLFQQHLCQVDLRFIHYCKVVWCVLHHPYKAAY